MAEITYYNKSTGKIITAVSGDLSILDLSAYSEYANIEGHGDASTQYVENGKFVDMPEKPSIYSVFDYESKTWLPPSFESQSNLAKIRREMLLSKSDWTQLPDVPTDKKSAWAEYRQKLRDITTQDDYPFAIIWPTEPR